jgi:hypothetical protein
MENIQAYNRYSYCLNNPLKYIDPSGYVRSNPIIRQDEKFLMMMEEWDRYENERMRYGGGTYSPYGWFLRPGEAINGVYYDGDSQSFRLVDDPSMVISRSEAIAIAMGEKRVGSSNGRYGYYEYVNFPLSYYPTGLSKPLPDEQGLREIGEVVISVRFVPFTTQTNIPTGDGGYSVDNAVGWLNENSYSSYSTAKAAGDGARCARFIRWSLEAGFGLQKDALTGKAPVPARLYGPFLQGLGFTQVNTTNYLKGDIAVIQGYPGGTSDANGVPYGHIQMYNGTQWLSNFYQNNFWPGSNYQKYQPTYQIYRMNP